MGPTTVTAASDDSPAATVEHDVAAGRDRTAGHRRAGRTRPRRLGLPLACVVLAVVAVSYGLTAPATTAALGPVRLAWLPFIAAGALVVLAPLVLVFAGLARIAPADTEHARLVETLARRAEEVEELLVDAVAQADRAGQDAATRYRAQALIVVRAIAEATQVDHPEGRDAVRAFSERLVAAFCYATPIPEDSTGVPPYPSASAPDGPGPARQRQVRLPG